MALQISSTIQIDRTVTAGPPAASSTAPDASASTIDVVLRLSRAPFEPVGDVPAAAGEGPADAARVVHVHIDETMLRLVHEIASGAADATAIPSRLSAHKPVLERLTTALDTAGIGTGALARNPDYAVRLAIAASLFDVQGQVAPETEQKGGAAPLLKWRLKRVLAHVEANISEPITLADLASVAGMSRMYFASQFRAATGMRPHEWVLRKRIEHAQRLLVTSADSLVGIALSVGFQTQAHFTTVFRKFVGDTPHRWRREQLSIAA